LDLRPASRRPQGDRRVGRRCDHLFVFRNRRGDRLKILARQGDGFALYLRRLERGTFAFPSGDTADLSITMTELAMILGGVEWQRTRRRTRYRQPEPALK
jgi:transposase